MFLLNVLAEAFPVESKCAGSSEVGDGEISKKLPTNSTPLLSEEEFKRKKKEIFSSSLSLKSVSSVDTSSERLRVLFGTYLFLCPSAWVYLNVQCTR